MSAAPISSGHVSDRPGERSRVPYGWTASVLNLIWPARYLVAREQRFQAMLEHTHLALAGAVDSL